MVEVGTCGNLHILDLVDTIRKNIGYHIVEQKFPDNVLLATGDVEGKSNELPGMVPLDDISALYKGMALEASRQRGYDQPVLPLRNDPEARLQESNYWEFDVMREGLERLQTIGWIVGEVEAGNMGVTEVFKIFERT